MDDARDTNKRKLDAVIGENDCDTSNLARQLRVLVNRTIAELGDPTNNDELAPCGNAPLSIIRQRPQAVLQLAHNKIHSYSFHSVPRHWRRLYEEASIYLALESLKSACHSTTSSISEDVVRRLDLALIIAGAPGRRRLIESLLQSLQRIHQESSTSNDIVRFSLRAPDALHTAQSIRRAKHTLDICEFQVHMDTNEVPLIIPDALVNWPALSRWQNVSYLLDATLDGKRLVPIEVGRSYTDEHWTQKIVSFKQFVDEYLLPEHPTEVGYLAQHDLFTQIPALRDDILVPDYCYASPASSAASSSDAPMETGPVFPFINAWLGPRGTKTPLHTDPYHNIFCQVVGYKYIRLYAPDQTPKLYPRATEESGISMENTSQVDVFHFRPSIGEEYEHRTGPADDMKREYPQFAEAYYQEAILGPGECLYIPAGWWHYLESLTPSFSVSFWWS